MMIKDFVPTYGKNRKPGKEPARKPENPRIAGWHHPIVANMSLIDNFAWTCYMVRNFAVASGRRCRAGEGGTHVSGRMAALCGLG
jgi:hypothetical protein